MNTSRAFALFSAVALFLVAVRAEEVAVESVKEGCLVLTDANFDDTIKSGDTLVKFYAPWCSHCKKLAPVWDAAADAARGKVKVSKVDCTSYSSVCDRYEVKGYPTIKFFRDGEAQDYKGRRSAEGVVEFADKMTGPAVTAATVDDVKKALANAETVRYVFVGAGKKGAARDVYAAVARRYQGNTYLFWEAPADQRDDIASLLKVKGGSDQSALVVVKDGTSAAYAGEFTAEAVGAWVKESRHPILRELTADSFDDTVYGGKLAAVCIIKQIKSKTTKEYLETIKAVSKEMSPQYVFSYLIADGNEQGVKFAQQFDLSHDLLPRVVVMDAPKDVHYTQEADSPNTRDGVATFLKRVKAGEVEAQGPGASFMNKLYEYYKQHKTAFHIMGAFMGFGFLSTLIAACVAIIRAEDDDEGTAAKEAIAKND